MKNNKEGKGSKCFIWRPFTFFQYHQMAEDFRQLTEKRGFMSKKIYFLEMYPSLIAYLNRIFIDGSYKFEKGIEPPYLNRNWLMHGRMNRSIERYECIQILNALSVIEFMFGDR